MSEKQWPSVRCGRVCNYAQHRWGKWNTDINGRTYDRIGFSFPYLSDANEKSDRKTRVDETLTETSEGSSFGSNWQNNSSSGLRVTLARTLRRPLNQGRQTHPWKRRRNTAHRDEPMRHAHDHCVNAFACCGINDHFHGWDQHFASLETETLFRAPFLLQVIFESIANRWICRLSLFLSLVLLRCSDQSFHCPFDILDSDLFPRWIFESLSNPVAFLVAVYIHVFQTNGLTINILGDGE